MIKRLRRKLCAERGESLAEVLVAVLISGLALVLLLSMIISSKRLIEKGQAEMDKIYQAAMTIEQDSVGVVISKEKVKITDNDTASRLADVSVEVSVHKDSDSILSRYDYQQ